MKINISIDSVLAEESLQRLNKKMDDWTEELKASASLISQSIDLNFMMQGRPSWKTQSKRAIEENGQTLQDTGRLRASFMVEVSSSRNSDSLYILKKDELIMGTEVPYYKYLHERWPVLMVQDDDIKNIEKIFRSSIEEV
jgi:phage gpG-like protein